MSNINILSSLNVATQKPLDGKTHRNNLSEIQNVDNSSAYMYYAGMIVTIASNNLQYVWKEVVLDETPISNIFTYPVGHIVEGYNYGGKSFAFYKVKNESSQSQGKYYTTELVTRPYTAPSALGVSESIGSIYSHKTTSQDPSDSNHTIETLHIRPIVSSSLQVYRMVTELDSQDGRDIPLRIEYTGVNNPVQVGPDRKFKDVEEAILDGATNITLNPVEGNPFVIKGPITTDVVIHAPKDVVIQGPGNGLPIFSNNGAIQKFKIEDGANVKLKSPLLSLSNSGNFELSGKGSLQIETAQPLIKTEGTGVIEIEDLSIVTNRATLASITEGGELNVKHVSINSESSNQLFEVTDSKLNISNSDLKLKTVFAVATSGSSETVFESVNVKGNVRTLISVAETSEGKSSSLLLNNSNLKDLDAEYLISTPDNPKNVNAEILKLNNTIVKDASNISNNINVTTSNVQTSTSKSTLTVPRYNSRAEADRELPENSIFINMQNTEDPSEWNLDFTIKT